MYGPGLETLVQPLDPADPPIDDMQDAAVIVVIGPNGLIPIHDQHRLGSVPPFGGVRFVLAMAHARHGRSRLRQVPGSASSADLAAAAGSVAREAGWRAVTVPLADGGEGSLKVLGGADKVTTVPDPLGRPVEAGSRLDGREAFIEMAAASGLLLVGGADLNDPMLADTAARAGSSQPPSSRGSNGVRDAGGSATTDGGLGAIDAMPDRGQDEGDRSDRRL